MGGQWSTYWYNGYIYGSEIARGVDVFRLVPTKFLTQNEIDASNQVHFDELNVQNQPKVVWPSNLIVARAYLDQLARGTSLSPQTLAALTGALGKSDQSGTAANFKTLADRARKSGSLGQVSSRRRSYESPCGHLEPAEVGRIGA